MDARGLRAEMLIEGVERATLALQADWTLESDKVLIF